MGTNSIIYRKKNMQEIPKFYLISPVGDYPLQILHSTKKYAIFLKNNMSIYRINTGTSWSNSNNSKEKQMKALIGIVNMLKEFNKYSKEKYQNSISVILKDMSYKILRYNLEVILTKTECKKYYENLGLKEKIRIFRKKIKKNLNKLIKVKF